jgi:hypothetical protein
VFPKHVVCLRNISVDALLKGDTEDNNNNIMNIDDTWYALIYFVSYYTVVDMIYFITIRIFKGGAR